jgi:biopolymer transport protein ExbD
VAPADSAQTVARAFWRLAKEPFQEVSIEKLQPIFEAEGKKNPKLVVLVKIDRKAKYQYMVNIIDQLQFAELNRFSLAPLLPEEKKEVETL